MNKSLTVLLLIATSFSSWQLCDRGWALAQYVKRAKAPRSFRFFIHELKLMANPGIHY